MNGIGALQFAPARPSIGLADIAGRSDLELLVTNFYRDAAVDDILGPIFTFANVDWPGHIATLTDFWAWQLLGIRGYEGDPLAAHQHVHDARPFTAAHFTRWLELFEENVHLLFSGPTATNAIERARKMAHATSRLLSGASDSGQAAAQPIWTSPPQQIVSPRKGAPTQSIKPGLSAIQPLHGDLEPSDET
jgi:hemoglobin